MTKNTIKERSRVMEETNMENNLQELSFEELTKALGGELDATNRRSIDLMIKLYKARGEKMEEVYQIRGLSDEIREYIRENWYRI